MEFEEGEWEFYVAAMVGAGIMGSSIEYELGFLTFAAMAVTSGVCLYIALTKFPRKDK